MTIAFMDVEASSLHDGSYPTEIGFVRHDFSGGFVALVRPEPSWLDWDPAAEAITSLSRDSIIRLGEPVGHVATAMKAQ